MMSNQPVGIRKPWQWVQPHGTDEILARLADCRDLNVSERERENMCSVAHEEIKRQAADIGRLTRLYNCASQVNS